MFSGVPNGPLRLSPPQVHAAVHNSGATDLRTMNFPSLPTVGRIGAHLKDPLQLAGDTIERIVMCELGIDSELQKCLLEHALF